MFVCLFFPFPIKLLNIALSLYLHLGSHCVEVCTHTHTHTHTHTGFPSGLAGKEVCTHTHTHTHTGFPCGLAGKESACSTGDLVSIPGLGRSPGEGKGYSLQYSGLENSMDYSPWDCKEPDMTHRVSLIYICLDIHWTMCLRLCTALQLSRIFKVFKKLKRFKKI